MRLFVLSSSFPRNVFGQGPPGDEYCGPPSHYFPQGEATHPRNGVGHGGAFSHVPVPPGPQLGIGRGTSLQQQPPMGRSHRPASPSAHKHRSATPGGTYDCDPDTVSGLCWCSEPIGKTVLRAIVNQFTSSCNII